MKIFFVLFLKILCFSYSFCQNAGDMPRRMVQFHIGRTKHGTGDMRGVSFNFAYTQYLHKRVSGFLDFGASIHDDTFPIFYTAMDGRTIDSSILYTTAGIQSTFGVGYSMLRTRKHELQSKLGGVLRYQSTSFYDSASVYFPIVTGLPFPVVAFQNELPPQTFAVGGMLGIAYHYTFNQKWSLGAMANFQLDTNGDTLSGLFINTGIRF